MTTPRSRDCPERPERPVQSKKHPPLPYAPGHVGGLILHHSKPKPTVNSKVSQRVWSLSVWACVVCCVFMFICESIEWWSSGLCNFHLWASRGPITVTTCSRASVSTPRVRVMYFHSRRLLTAAIKPHDVVDGHQRTPGVPQRGCQRVSID